MTIEMYQDVMNHLQIDKYRELIIEQDHKITELEKENAELKEKYVKNITDCDICDTYCNSQLTKAKEIIKAFLDSSDLNIKHKAEEFLGEF